MSLTQDLSILSKIQTVAKFLKENFGTPNSPLTPLSLPLRLSFPPLLPKAMNPKSTTKNQRRNWYKEERDTCSYRTHRNSIQNQNQPLKLKEESDTCSDRSSIRDQNQPPKLKEEIDKKKKVTLVQTEAVFKIKINHQNSKKKWIHRRKKVTLVQREAASKI